MAGTRQRRAVRFKGGIAHGERVAPANGRASPMVNIVPRPTDGRNESGVGAMHPSGEAESNRDDWAAAEAGRPVQGRHRPRSEEHTSELQSRGHLVCRLLLEKKK